MAQLNKSRPESEIKKWRHSLGRFIFIKITFAMSFKQYLNSIAPIYFFFFISYQQKY